MVVRSAMCRACRVCGRCVCRSRGRGDGVSGGRVDPSMWWRGLVVRSCGCVGVWYVWAVLLVWLVCPGVLMCAGCVFCGGVVVGWVCVVYMDVCILY